MPNNYSKLQIDKSKIKDWIQLWGEENLPGSFTINCTEIPQRFQYSIVSDGNNIKLDFIKCKGDLLTIYPNVGTHVNTSMEIAEYIYTRVKNNIVDSPFAHGFSIILSECDFSAMIELLNGYEGVTLQNYSEQLENCHAKYKLYRFSGPAGDAVTLKYFLSTKRMQLQGKPLWLFNEIVKMVSDYGTPPNDIVDAHLRYCSLNISRNEIYEEMESILGKDVYAFLSSTQKALLATTFILDKIEIDMPDYSGLITPAFRSYEGFAKKVFAQKGLQCEGEHQLGEFFERANKMEPFRMKNCYSEKLDSKTEQILTSMYAFYYNKRHPYSHASAYDFSTPIISNRRSAEEIFQEIIHKMKLYYSDLM